MITKFFIKGIIIGFSIAAPVGPIGVLCIKRSLQYGRLAGLATGLGAASADIIFGIIAAFGLTTISSFLFTIENYLMLLGGLFLIYLGIITFFSKTERISIEKITSKNMASSYMSTFFLTLTNPLTILSFVAVFAGLGLANTHGNYEEAFFLVLGVGLGSALWWLLLTEFVTLFRKKMSRKIFHIINYFAGVIIFLFGAYALFLFMIRYSN